MIIASSTSPKLVVVLIASGLAPLFVALITTPPPPPQIIGEPHSPGKPPPSTSPSKEHGKISSRTKRNAKQKDARHRFY